MTFIELCLKNERMPLKIKTCSSVRSNLILLLVRFKGHYRKQPNYSINQRIFFLGQIKKKTLNFLMRQISFLACTCWTMYVDVKNSCVS